MTTEDALIIKKWRVAAGCSWRMIAYYAHEKWPDRNIDSGNQIDGMDLCTEAAKTLGEDPSTEPWN